MMRPTRMDDAGAPPAAATVSGPSSSALARRYGPWALVTGASSGIGRAVAEQLAAAGLDLVLVARRADVLQEIAAELAGRCGVQARALPADLARPEGVSAVLAATAGLDVGLLVAAAGFGTAGPFLDSRLAEQQEMLDVNCGAVLTMTHTVATGMAARGRGGGIVLLASLVGRQGAPNAAHYAATKAYVQALGEGLHVELGPRGIDVLAATPGPVRSGFADRAGMRLDAAVSAERVAAGVLAALPRGRMTTSPGLLSKVLGGSLAGLPRPVRTRVMGRVMGRLAAR